MEYFVTILTILLIIIGVVLFAIAYSAPSILAFHYNIKDRWWIFLLNMVLGYTAIGWVASFAWFILEKKDEGK